MSNSLIKLNTTPTNAQLENSSFWDDKERGVIDSEGYTIIPRYSVFVDGHVIKYEREPNIFQSDYSYDIALDLASYFDDATIEVVGYNRKLP